jgi:hypothetical protein
VLYQLSYCGGPNSALRICLKTRAPDIGQRPILQEKRARPKPYGAFSSEVDTGSRKENASKQKIRARF